MVAKHAKILKNMRNIFKREKGTLFRGQKIWMLKNQSNVIEGEIGTAFIMNGTVQKKTEGNYMLVIQNRRGEDKWKRKNESEGHRGENCR